MTWDAYNRRKATLHEILAAAEEQDSGLEELLIRTGHSPAEEIDVLLAAQMVWAQALSSQLERGAFLGDGTLESDAIAAWRHAAAEHPMIRRLLDHATEHAELQRAFAQEHAFLARAVGVPANHPDVDGQGKRIKEAARAGLTRQPTAAEAPMGLIARIREVIAA